jgi:hypothetical protein
MLPTGRGAQDLLRQRSCWQRPCWTARYRLIQPTEAGGFGQAWMAHDPRNRSMVFYLSGLDAFGWPRWFC